MTLDVDDDVRRRHQDRRHRLLDQPVVRLADVGGGQGQAGGRGPRPDPDLQGDDVDPRVDAPVGRVPDGGVRGRGRAPEPEAVDVDALGELAALQGVVKFPVRIKCATLSWNTLAQGLDEVGGHRLSRPATSPAATPSVDRTARAQQGVGSKSVSMVVVVLGRRRRRWSCSRPSEVGGRAVVVVVVGTTPYGSGRRGQRRLGAGRRGTGVITCVRLGLLDVEHGAEGAELRRVRAVGGQRAVAKRAEAKRVELAGQGDEVG